MLPTKQQLARAQEAKNLHDHFYHFSLTAPLTSIEDKGETWLCTPKRPRLAKNMCALYEPFHLRKADLQPFLKEAT